MFENLFFIIALLPIILLVSVTVNSTSVQWAIGIGKSILVASVLAVLPVLVLMATDWQFGNTTLGFPSIGLSLRLDTLSTTMFTMVSIIGFIVLGFSKNYLAGDHRQITFVRRLLLTIALVQLLVISGSLITLFTTWVATSFSLLYLIKYYQERKEAQRAVRKKFIIARMSDVSLFTSMCFLYWEFGTVDLETIFNGLKAIGADSIPFTLELSAIFLVLAAITKSVQVPFHGWLLGVMDAPTPVSALLHAGLLNAGPFLIIRFAFLMDVTTTASLMLLVIGGISALYGTIVFPSQPSVKTSLAYSSIGHMGFSLMVCGMGLYPAALLHFVAHSFYKAHSFLSSGSAIDKHRLNQLKGDVHFNLSVLNIIIGFSISALLYLGIAELWGGLAHHNFQLLILGAIILTGVTSYMAKHTSLENGVTIVFKSIMISGFVLLSFFFFENSIATLIAQQIPLMSEPGIAGKSISVMLLMAYGTTVFLPMLSGSSMGEVALKWETHRRNGFYLHILFDRALSVVYPKMTK